MTKTNPLKEQTSSEQAQNFDHQDWVSAYCNVEEELSNINLLLVSGDVPHELSGYLYKNGPGRLERNGQWVHHPFDGDGMISAFHFQNGVVSLSNRFVQTKAWQEEEKAGEFLYRGVFGTQKKGGVLNNAFDLRLKNIANTNVIRLGNDLLALWEASMPHALNPTTLKTIGISNLDGVLDEGEAFSAHPRFDPGHHGEPKMVNFGVKTGPKSTLRLMEFATEGKDAGKLLSDRKDIFKGFAFLHDFAITPNWAIFLQNAIQLNPIPYIFGQKGAAQCLSSKSNAQSKFLLIPRDSGDFAGKDVRIFPAPDGFVFHHLNAWEEDKNVVIESIYYSDFPSISPNQDFRKIDFKDYPEGKLKRCVIDTQKGSISLQLLSDQCCEFAMVNPNKVGTNARFSWMAIAAQSSGNGPLQAIKKLDLKSNEDLIWSAGNRGFVTEPIMISKENSIREDDGWVIVLVWNALRSGTDLVILNADKLTEQARLEVPISIPYGLHGSWTSK